MADTLKLIFLFWMLAMLYLVYNMWKDLAYITDLFYAYMRILMERMPI